MTANHRVRMILAGVLVLGMATAGIAQLRQAIKIVGVYAAVKQFGPDMNKAINKLSKHQDTAAKTTRVVPIITVGLNKTGAVGAAQIMGTKEAVAKVEAVAQPTADLFGREIRVSALIPVSDKDVKSGLKTVDGVAVTGIVDLRL